jgi:hypothetical protein
VKWMVRALFVLVAVGLPAWPLEATAGVLIVEKTIMGDNPPQTHQVQIDRDWMRMEHQISGEKQAFVFDGAKQVIWIVNLAKKTYSEMTKADVDRLGGQMTEAMTRMQEQLKNLPPDQRAMVEQMMKSRGMGAAGATPPKTVYRKAGTDKVGRWACDRYEGYQNDQKTSELCTVDPAALGFVPADFEVSRKLAEFFRKLVPQNAENLFAIGKVEEQGFAGVPVRRVFAVGQGTATTEMTEVSRQNFPRSTFEVPAGFKKVAFGER